jgi:Rrf2 family protein
MGTLSQKCYYALRAIHELTARANQGPIKIGDVAAAQSIPPRFLEVILNELKQGGFVESKRGKEGGYFLVREPEEITVGEVIRFVEGPFAPVDCVCDEGGTAFCPLGRECAFLPLWQRVHAAMASIYDGTTFAMIHEEDLRRRGKYVPDFVI